MKHFKDSKLLAKHEVVTIDSLLGLINPTPVYILNQDPSGFKDKWGMKGGKHLPKRMIIIGVGYNKTTTGEFYNITYHFNEDGFKFYHTSCLLPGTILAKLTGTSARYLSLKHSEAAITNLHLNLNRLTSRIGSDPEIFVVNGKDELVPAFEFLPSKASKEALTLNEGKPVYWDGFQAEFETKPNDCLAFHVDSVQLGLDAVLREARKKDPKAKLSVQTVFDIPPEMLQTAKKEHVELGCMPSFNAYGLKSEPVPDCRKLDVRSAGGHIHFDLSYLPEAKAKIPELVKALDAVLGVSCVAMFANFDNPIRRKYYGQAGEYRTPAHGLEYRTLSNAWLVHPFIMNIVFDIARVTLSLGFNGHMKHWKGTEAEIIEIINTCNVDKAKHMMLKNKSILYSIYQAAYGTMTDPQLDKLFSVFYNGMETVIETPNDIEKNWCLGKDWYVNADGIGDRLTGGRQTERWTNHGETKD